jgi:tetratricopeptide (TPR) repeat protein
MKNITKISIISGIVIFLLLFGVSQYKHIKIKTSPIYTTIYKSNAGVMTIGGMASDKDKLDSFKKSLEQDKEYSDRIYAAIQYEKSGDFENAIREREKALEGTKYVGDIWEARVRLATLYEKVGKYDLALKQYDVIIPIQEEALASALKTTYKLEISRREKLVNDLKESRKRIEGLIAK